MVNRNGVNWAVQGRKGPGQGHGPMVAKSIGEFDR